MLTRNDLGDVPSCNTWRAQGYSRNGRSGSCSVPSALFLGHLSGSRRHVGGDVLTELHRSAVSTHLKAVHVPTSLECRVLPLPAMHQPTMSPTNKTLKAFGFLDSACTASSRIGGCLPSSLSMWKSHPIILQTLVSRRQTSYCSVVQQDRLITRVCSLHLEAARKRPTAKESRAHFDSGEAGRTPRSSLRPQPAICCDLGAQVWTWGFTRYQTRHHHQHPPQKLRQLCSHEYAEYELHHC